MIKSNSFAQTDYNIDWSTGVVHLNNGRILSGLICQDKIRNLLYFRNEEMIRVYRADEVQVFQVLDKDEHRRRYYGSYQLRGRKTIFCERLLVGYCHFLKRSIYDANKNIYQAKFQNDYSHYNTSYFIWYDDQLIKLDNTGKHLKDLFDFCDLDLDEFLKESRLRPFRYIDQIRLVHKLNQNMVEIEEEEQESKGMWVETKY